MTGIIISTIIKNHSLENQVICFISEIYQQLICCMHTNLGQLGFYVKNQNEMSSQNWGKTIIILQKKEFKIYSSSFCDPAFNRKNNSTVMMLHEGYSYTYKQNPSHTYLFLEDFLLLFLIRIYNIRNSMQIQFPLNV